MLHPPASTQSDPILFDLVGSDIFEFEHLGKKHKLILWRDCASGYAVTQHLQEYDQHWESTAKDVKDVINSFAQWLMINPSPTWLITDAGVQYTLGEFISFCQSSGIGLLMILGAEESTIGTLKASVTRLLKEEPSLTVSNAFALACHMDVTTPLGHLDVRPFNGFVVEPLLMIHYDLVLNQRRLLVDFFDSKRKPALHLNKNTRSRSSQSLAMPWAEVQHPSSLVHSS